MGLSQATHRGITIGTGLNDAQWREWILKEEMIRYVLACVLEQIDKSSPEVTAHSTTYSCWILHL